MYVDTDGLVIRQIKIGDGRRMIVLFTRKYGKISAGTSISERGKNKSALVIRPFTYGHYNLYKSRSGYSISGAEVINSFFGLGENVDKFMLASYILEFTDKLLPDEEPNEKILELLLEFFKLLSERKSHFETLSCGYQARALKYSGLEMRFGTCACCGRKVPQENSASKGEHIFFSVPDGGVICTDCANESVNTAKPPKQLIFEVDFGIVEVLRYLTNNPLERLRSVALDDKTKQQIIRILDAYASYHLGIEIKFI